MANKKDIIDKFEKSKLSIDLLRQIKKGLILVMENPYKKDSYNIDKEEKFFIKVLEDLVDNDAFINCSVIKEKPVSGSWNKKPSYTFELIPSTTFEIESFITKAKIIEKSEYNKVIENMNKSMQTV